VAGAAAAVNCLIEQKIDAVMARTRAARCRAAK
jgi:heme O synthase-like polyprenyltransferase